MMSLLSRRCVVALSLIVVGSSALPADQSAMKLAAQMAPSDEATGEAASIGEKLAGAMAAERMDEPPEPSSGPDDADGDRHKLSKQGRANLFGNPIRHISRGARSIAHGASSVAHGAGNAASSVAHGAGNAANTIAHGAGGAANTIAHGATHAAHGISNAADAVIRTTRGALDSVGTEINDAVNVSAQHTRAAHGRRHPHAPRRRWLDGQRLMRAPLRRVLSQTVSHLADELVSALDDMVDELKDMDGCQIATKAEGFVNSLLRKMKLEVRAETPSSIARTHREADAFVPSLASRLSPLASRLSRRSPHLNQVKPLECVGLEPNQTLFDRSVTVPMLNGTTATLNTKLTSSTEMTLTAYVHDLKFDWYASVPTVHTDGEPSRASLSRARSLARSRACTRCLTRGSRMVWAQQQAEGDAQQLLDDLADA